MKHIISCKYIGQATALLDIGGTQILTDPIFSNRMFFLKRHAELPIAPSKLPEPDVILVSHMHFDHFDIGSYKYILRQSPIVVPEGCGDFVSKFVSNPVVELSLFATHRLSDGTRITAVDAKHKGGRYTQLRYTAANSYLIQKDESVVYFCGDSAYGDHFKEVGNMSHIDLALLPIGCYLPQWFMKKRHMTPAEVVKAFEDLKAAHMVPIHWGTFSTSLEPLGQPVALLKKILEERPELKSSIHILQHGEEFSCG